MGTQIFGGECIEDASHKGSDVVLQTLRDLKKSQATCDGWLQRDRKAKWLTAKQDNKRNIQNCVDMERGMVQRFLFVYSMRTRSYFF